jgi:transposase-like protein
VAKRRYSDEEKAEALATLEANDGNIHKTAQDTGIPWGTLKRWVEAQDQFTHLREQKKSDLAQRLEEIARELADAMPDKIQAATLQQVATSMAIAIDKMQLLRGAPTSISDIAIEQIADRIERMTDDERAILARQIGEGDPDSA